SGWRAFAPIILPIMLIGAGSIANYPSMPLGRSGIYQVLSFLGDPVLALLAGAFMAMPLKSPGQKGTHSDWVLQGLKNAGVIILITGAGGAFGNVLRLAGIGTVIGEVIGDWHGGFLFPFLIATLLKSAQGSSTVSIITTAALVSPLLEPLGMSEPLGRALAVLAIGAGAMTVSHVNDSYFWVVSQFSDLDTATALRSHTLATFFQGLTGILVVMCIAWILI
ncbi:MAG: GntP family permease, partial [Calditrichales bacterium]